MTNKQLIAYLIDEVPPKLKRRTPAQKKAMERHTFELQQYDRFMGSVFASTQGQRMHEAKIDAAYADCIATGCNEGHGFYR